MQQSVPAKYLETSYSALLHGPDTPPFHSEPGWDTSSGGEHYSAAEQSSLPLKGVIKKDPASLNGCEGAAIPFGTRNVQPENTRTQQRPLTIDTSHLDFADAKEQAAFNRYVGQRPVHHLLEHGFSPRHVKSQQGFYGSRGSQQLLSNQECTGEKPDCFHPFEQVDSSLPHNRKSFMQSQQCAMSFNLEKRNVNNTHPQLLQDTTEESAVKQLEDMALPSREMPTVSLPNASDTQQYSAWNVMNSQSISGDGGSYMQNASHTGYNRCDTNVWLDGHHFLQHTPYLPYGSGHTQMAVNHHAPYSWQTHTMGTVRDAYPYYNPDGYYSWDNNFSGIGETDHAAPPPYVNYGHHHHHQEPRVYLPPADRFLPGFTTPVIEGECNSSSYRTFGTQVLANQMNHERLVIAGGQGKLRQPQSNFEDHRASTNIVKQSREEETGKSANANKESAFHEDVELEGPQAKKMRECLEYDAYHLKPSHFSQNFSPQPGASLSMNMTELSRVDGTPISSRNFTDVQGSTRRPSVQDCRSQALSQGCGFESRMDQQGQSFQRSGTPSHLWTNDTIQSETPANLILAHTSNRNHTRSTSSRFFSENGAGISQSDSTPGVRYLPGAQQMQEHEINNGYNPGGFYDAYKEEFSSTRTNTSEQDQSSDDLPLRQLGGRGQVAIHPGTHAPLKSSTAQQLPMSAVALKSTFPGNEVLSGAATQELSKSQCIMFKPSNIGDGPGSTGTSNIRCKGMDTENYTFSTTGHSYSDKDEYRYSNLHPESEPQRTVYPMTNAYPSHLRPLAQTPELTSFDHSKIGPLETGAQLMRFSRPALEKFYPPPPFHSRPVRFHRESERVANTSTEFEILPEVHALENFEAAMLTGRMKEISPQLVNHQGSAGFLVDGGYLYPATGGQGAMRRGSGFEELSQVHQLPISTLEAGSMNRQQPGNTVVYAHAAHKVPSTTTTVGSQGLAEHTKMLRDTEISKPSQPSACPDPLTTGRSLRQANDDRHLPPEHYGEVHTVGRENSTLVDGEAASSGKTLSERIPQQSLKANLRAPLTMQPRKRKKSVSCLVPWHIVTTQPKAQLSSLSKSEVMWATATNRLLEKDGGVASDLGIFRAESRLRLTTQLMQQIFAPLPSILMHGKQPANLGCGVYNLSKSALGEACRLITSTQRENESAQKNTDINVTDSSSQIRTWNMAKEVAMTRLVERFMDRVKRLDFELARLDCSMSVLEVRGKTHDFERLSIIHRLGKHYGPDFSKSLSENGLVDAFTNHGRIIRKTLPQKYVIAVPMPRTLPEGARCLSL